MNWGQILKRSWEYFKKHRSLWYLGILAALTEGSFGSSFGSGKGSAWKENSFDYSKYSNQAAEWVAANYAQIGIVALAIFIISLIILYVSYSSRAGLIHSVNQLEEKNLEPEFHRDFHAGQEYFWRFLGLTVLVALIMLGVLAAIVIIAGGLIVLAITVSLWFLILAVPVALASIVGIVVLSIYFNVVLYLAYRAIVIDKKKIVPAINHARDLIHDNFANVILSWLIHIAFNTAFAIAMLIAGALVIGILTAIGVGLYYAAGSTITLVYGSIAFVALALALLTVSGGLNAYFSTFWTIVYRKLT